MAARVFYLVRLEDPTGTSGTGIVAEGISYSAGDAMVKWTGERPCFQHWPNGWRDAASIHGHGGKTKVVWKDDDPPPDPVKRREPEDDGVVTSAKEVE